MNSISPKIAVSALVGALVTVCVWVVQSVWHITIPGEVGAALTTIFSGVAGWLTPHTTDPQP
jgi:hypothetical protein